MQFFDFTYFWDNVYKDFIDTTVCNIFVKMSEIFDFYIYKDENGFYMNQWYFIRDNSDRENPIGFYSEQMSVIYKVLQGIADIQTEDELKTFITKLDNNNKFENIPNDIYFNVMEISNFLNTNVRFATDIEKPKELTDLTHQLLQTYSNELNLFDIGYYMNDIESMLANIPKINYKSDANISLLFELPYVNFLRLQKVNKSLDIVNDCLTDLNNVLKDNGNDIVIIVLVTILNLILMSVLYIYLDELNFQQVNNELIHDLASGFFNNGIIDANIYNYFNNIYNVTKLYDFSYLDIYIQKTYEVVQKITLALS